MTMCSHPVFDRLREAARNAPLVVAHRGASDQHPENTLAAFAAARQLGVPMQEFDVRTTRDGVLVCIHDETCDRTSDAARRLGPGALVAQLRHAELANLDMGRWKSIAHAGERMPTLAEALAAIAPAVPMIEHKAGTASAYVAAITAAGQLHGCILQSFDWSFLAAAHQLAPELALAALGPGAHAHPDDDALAAAGRFGAGMLHWAADALTRDDVERIHAAGMLVCTYTTDQEVGWYGGAQLGFDAMCTNRPARMQELVRAGRLRRS